MRMKSSAQSAHTLKLNPENHRNPSRLAYRLIAFATAFFVLLSCGIFPSGDSLNVSKDLPSAKDVSLPGIDTAEQAQTASMREPVRQLLGAEADRLYKKIDSAKSDLYSKMAARVKAPEKNSSGSLPGRPAASQEHSDVIMASLFTPSGLSRKGPAVLPQVGGKQGIAFTSVSAMLASMFSLASNIGEGTISNSDKYEKDNIKGENKYSITRSGSKITMEMDMNLTGSTGDGAAITDKAHGKLEMTVCPDADGIAPVTISLESRTDGTKGTATASSQTGLSTTAKVNVDDNAEIISYDFDMKGSEARSGADSSAKGQDSGTKGQFAEVSIGMTLQGNSNSSVQTQLKSAKVTRSSSAATQQFASDTAAFTMKVISAMVVIAASSAKDLWQNGYCVEVKVTGVSDSDYLVEPSSTRKFTASVHHKFEDSDLNVPIQGTLSGEKSLSPTARKDAPVDYIYTAPGEKDKKATVTLETRSKRGAAKKSLEFGTAPVGWEIDEMVDLDGAPVHFHGFSCKSQNGPWEIHGDVEFQGVKIEMVTNVQFGEDGNGTASNTMKLTAVGKPIGMNSTSSGQASIAPSGEDYTITLDAPGSFQASAFGTSPKGKKVKVDTGGNSTGAGKINLTAKRNYVSGCQ